MRGFAIPGLAFLVVLSLAVVVHASSWSIANLSLSNTIKPITVYNVTNGTLSEKIMLINYTALMLQSIEFNLRHHISLNQTQLFYLALLQALSTQGSNAPSITSVSISDTGAQPLGPYSSYEVFLINASLSSPAQSLIIYSEPAVWENVQNNVYLVALPGSDFAFGYIVFEETASECYYTFITYEPLFYPSSLVSYVIGNGWETPCPGILYEPLYVSVSINGKTYTLTFEPYTAPVSVYPQYPNTIELNTTANAGGVGVYDVPFTTPLAICYAWGLMVPTSCILFPPTNFTFTVPSYLSQVVYYNMPAIIMYPTQPGYYTFGNIYMMPPGGTMPVNKILIINAYVTGPSVENKELFDVSLPYGSCGTYAINPSPLQLSGVANYGYLAEVLGNEQSQDSFISFAGWVAGYDTNTPGFTTAVLTACDYRGFWSLTPMSVSITLTDGYGNPVGYGVVTFGPNYYAWLIIGVAIALVVAVVAVAGSVYGWVGAEKKEKGEVVIRL